MTRATIGQKYSNRIRRVLENIKAALSQKGIFVDDPWPYNDFESWQMPVFWQGREVKPKVYFELTFKLDWKFETQTTMFVASLYKVEAEEETEPDAGEYFNLLWQVTPGIRSQLEDWEGIEWQLRYFESQDVKNEIVSRIMKAVVGEGPREWSPRWETPSMGAAARGMKPIRINIVEEEGWKNWDYATDGGISQWASDNAWDDWTNMSDEDCQRYVQEIIDASMTKAERKNIGDEDLERICEEMKEHVSENLEETLRAITDAHTWAWEKAYEPDDRDIGKAMEKTSRNWEFEFGLSDFWDLVLEEEQPEGPREWSPRWSESDLYEDLLKRIRYERKPGDYDRFMIFDWGDAEPVKAVLEALKKNRKKGHADDVENELRDWAERYMRAFFKELEERMEQNDPNYNWDLDPHWKNMLKDKQTMSNVRRELLEFLAKPRKQEVED